MCTVCELSVFSSADMAFHGGGKTWERAEGDAERNTVVWNDSVMMPKNKQKTFF